MKQWRSSAPKSGGMGGTNFFPEKWKAKKKSICIKIVLKGGVGVLPQKKIYRIRYKIRQF